MEDNGSRRKRNTLKLEDVSVILLLGFILYEYILGRLDLEEEKKKKKKHIKDD